VKFSVRFNNDLPLADYPRLARAAEVAGFDQFWVSDDLFWRSALVILSSVALATESIQIGTCVVNPYTLHPAEMAMAAATLDELSGGRFLLGLSSGAGDFLEWVGIHPERPVAAVRETVARLRALWCGAAPDGWAPEARLRFVTREIPIYLGAMSPNMLRLIGEVADGGLPLLFPPEVFGDVLDLIGPLARDVDIAACIWCSVSSDRDAAERVLRDKIAYYGHALSDLILSRLGVERAEFEPVRAAVHAGDADRAARLVTPAMLQIGVVGTAADLLPRLQGLVAQGARHLSFGPPLGPDPFDAIETLGRDVLPHFRSAR
jgi:5,10-methylenetetrahydromethanopterin reductase